MLVNSELFELHGVGYLGFQLFLKRLKIRASMLLCFGVNSENLNPPTRTRTNLTALARPVPTRAITTQHQGGIASLPRPS
jgi:hypothetical protein